MLLFFPQGRGSALPAVIHSVAHPNSFPGKPSSEIPALQYKNKQDIQTYLQKTFSKQRKRYSTSWYGSTPSYEVHMKSKHPDTQKAHRGRQVGVGAMFSCRWMVFTMGSLLHHLLSQLLRTGENAVSLARVTFGRGIVERVWTWEPHGPKPRSTFMSWVGFRVLKQFRTYHPKICTFATLVILSCRLSELHLSA